MFIEDYSKLLELANRIYESGLVEYCHPNFIMEIEKFQDDLFYPDQYYLNNTGQFGGTPGIDINAPQAWAITTGLTDVRVAVLDDGVENHDDLNGRVVQGFSPMNATGFGAPVTGSDHGQACAGIVGATQNNTEGISGVAPCVDIVPINIFIGNESSADLAEAIDWAWDEGDSDVLSNSWGYTAQGTYHDNIAKAIGRARTQGRSGKGAIVVFASGNENLNFAGVTFPGNVPGVLTIGAIDNDGNIWNYSSRGPEMDLVAPSGNIRLTGDVITTDRMGNNGYVPGHPGPNNNYVSVFGGTSAACPQAAGAAALLISLDPTQSELTVKSRLTSTATDMGANGRDNIFGYGRINLQAALQRVTPKITGPSKFCPSGVMKVGNLTGGTITWSVSPSNSMSFTQGASISTFTRIGSFTGNATITATLNPACGTTVVITKNVIVEGSIDFNWYGVGPYGQLDVSITSGSPPHKIYRGSTLLYSGYSSYRTVNFGCNGGVLKVEANTACGVASKSVIVPQGCASFRGQTTMVVFPNPTSSELDIAQLDEYEKIRSADDIGPGELQLYGLDGNLLKTHKFSRIGSDTKMDVSDLKKGIFLLRIIAKEVDEVHRVVVE